MRDAGGLFICRTWHVQGFWRNSICRLRGHRWSHWSPDDTRHCTRECTVTEHRFRSEQSLCSPRLATWL